MEIIVQDFVIPVKFYPYPSYVINQVIRIEDYPSYDDLRNELISFLL